ncbi:hypothetical protein VTJ04DRAFT_9336 [Mycothermus thermophilus]|uniref:uncharacterized protein n=1 Tax=Humicola insolens TaxID=85995 RepID=UPI0037422B9C
MTCCMSKRRRKKKRWMDDDPRSRLVEEMHRARRVPSSFRRFRDENRVVVFCAKNTLPSRPIKSQNLPPSTQTRLLEIVLWSSG